MAGVDMENDSGVVVGTQTVPSIGGTDGGQIVETAHIEDAGGEPSSYNENPGVDLDGEGSGFPEGTSFAKDMKPLQEQGFK